jgi:hypothetical protein
MKSNILSHSIHPTIPHYVTYRFIFLFFPVLSKITFTKFWSEIARILSVIVDFLRQKIRFYVIKMSYSESAGKTEPMDGIFDKTFSYRNWWKREKKIEINRLGFSCWFRIWHFYYIKSYFVMKKRKKEQKRSERIV